MSPLTSSKWNWLASPKFKEIGARVVALIRAIRGTSSIVVLALLWSAAAPVKLNAAIASIGSLATANSKASQSSWTFTTSAQLDQNNAGVLVVAVDNQDSGDLNSTLCTSVSDAAGNDWVKAREFTNGQGSADAGATVCIFYTKAKANLASAANVTVTFSTTKTAKAATMWEFSISSAMILAVVGGADLANDGADAGSMSISGLASQEYLFVRGGSVESNGTTYTASTNYTSFTHTSSTTSGSTAATNIGARGEFRILAATSSSTDPTTSASDQASTFVALDEVSPPPAAGLGEFLSAAPSTHPPRMNKLNQLLLSCCLALALVIGIRVLLLAARIENDLQEARETVAATAAQLQLTLQSAQAVLVSVRATTEAVRRSSASQLGYYEAVGRRSSQLLAESTLLVRRTDRRLERLTSSAEGLLEDSRAAVNQANTAVASSARDINTALTPISNLVQHADDDLAAADIPRLAADLSIASEHLITTSTAAGEALGHINDILAPTNKGFWRRLLEAFIPHSGRPDPSPPEE